MKRRIAGICFGACLISSLLYGCGAKDTTEVTEVSETLTQEAAQESAYEEPVESTEVVMITDSGTVDDQSFNQSTWTGLAKYGAENGMGYQCIQPEELSTEAYLKTIDQAVKAGAKLIVCPGYFFEEAIYTAQTKYPEVKFILLDGTPHNSDYSDYTTGDNVMTILFQEDQSGFLAGYAAVKEGHTKLGFLGGTAVPGVVRYGYGFLQGVDAAATEDGVKAEVNYHYTGTFAATPDVEAMAGSWYQNGTEVIFGCGGSVGSAVALAAEDAGKLMIGVDSDQSSLSDTVLTSAMKELDGAAYDGVKSYYDGTFRGGRTIAYTVRNQGVGLPMETSRFKKFTTSDYEELLGKLKEDSFAIQTTGSDMSGLTLSSTTLNYIE